MSRYLPTRPSDGKPLPAPPRPADEDFEAEEPTLSERWQWTQEEADARLAQHAGEYGQGDDERFTFGPRKAAR